MNIYTTRCNNINTCNKTTMNNETKQVCTIRRYHDVIVSLRYNIYKQILYKNFRLMKTSNMSEDAISRIIYNDLISLLLENNGRFVKPSIENNYYVVDENEVKKSKYFLCIFPTSLNAFLHVENQFLTYSSFGSNI